MRNITAGNDEEGNMNPRTIRTEMDYSRMLKEIEKLITLDPEPGTDDAERLALLSMLIEKYESEKFPIDLPNPLDAIKFRMDEQGLRQKDLIPFIGSKSKVSEVLAGKRFLTVPMLRALHEGLGIPADVLLKEPKIENGQAEDLDWNKFPIKEIVKRGWIEVTVQESKKEAQWFIERLFEPLGGIEQVPVFCRRTFVERSGKSMDKYALLAWTARALAKAQSMDLTPYTSGTLDESIMKQVAKLSFSAKGPLEAQAFLAKHGIALVIVPHLPRTHLDGVAMLSQQSNPVIGLTVRHDRIDNFWFSLMHELAHVWKHLTAFDEAFVDNLDSGPGKDPREREADRVSGEILIPRSIWRRSDAYRQRSPDVINELAFKLNIHPAIIAGRIRHDAKNFYILTQMVGNGMVRKQFPDIRW